MRILALDLSKWSTGYAAWGPGLSRPAYGHWQLGSEHTPRGQVFTKLHRCLDKLIGTSAFDLIGFESPLDANSLKGHTNIGTLRIMSGLAAHAESYAFARKCQVTEVTVQSWRNPFLGSDVVSQINAEARAKRKVTGKKVSSTDRLKRLTIERCRQLGWNPKVNDEADALGILDYLIAREGMQAPWRLDETLRPPLEIPAC